MLIRIGAALVLVCSVAACSDNAKIVGGGAADAESAGNDKGQDVANQIDDEFAEDNDPVLVSQTGSIMRTLNDGEIMQANFALQTLSRTETENFAADLVAMHTQANADLNNVMRTYNVPFSATQAEAMLLAQANDGLARLQATPPAQIDMVFLEVQIEMHSAAKVMLDQLESENDTDPMDTFLSNSHDLVDDHLDRAIQIFDDLDFEDVD